MFNVLNLAMPSVYFEGKERKESGNKPLPIRRKSSTERGNEGFNHETRYDLAKPIDSIETNNAIRYSLAPGIEMDSKKAAEQKAKTLRSNYSGPRVEDTFFTNHRISKGASRNWLSPWRN